MEFIKNKIYYVVRNYSVSNVLSESDYREVVKCVYSGSDDTGLYVFNPTDNASPMILGNGDFICFESMDDYLISLFRGIMDINETAELSEFDKQPEIYGFDDFMIQKILESQEQHPERWI